jgi:hypothetical protein
LDMPEELPGLRMMMDFSDWFGGDLRNILLGRSWAEHLVSDHGVHRSLNHEDTDVARCLCNLRLVAR